MKKTTVHYFVISAFTILYAITSLISTVHVIDFFSLTNPYWLAVSLAIAFEIGAAASLASIIALDKMNKGIVWMLFIILTAMQAMGNTYYAYVHAENFQSWIELFGLVDEELIYQKRILSLISGGILPIVALGYIKALIDYIRPDENQQTQVTEDQDIEEPKISQIDQPLPSITNDEISFTTTQKPKLINPIVEQPIPIEQPIATMPPTTTESPRLNNTEKTTHRTPTYDELVARGSEPQLSGLKKPHDP